MGSDNGNGAAAGAYILEARNIVKLFGDLRANDDVSLSLKPGEIHALLGENGAGKSTLVKIIYGALQPTSGELFWNGSPVTISNPAAARELGIGMVFQHFSLFDALTVTQKHRAGPEGRAEHDGAGRADRDGLRRLRFAASAPCARGGSLGGRTPAHRGGALPVAGAPPADPGRAHRGPDPAGSRPALRHTGAPGRRRLRGALHLPSPGRGETPLPRRDDPAPRVPGGAGRSAAGIRRVPRPAHDRHRCRRAQSGERRGNRRAPARARRPLDADRRPVRRCVEEHRPRGPVGGGGRDRGCRGQRPVGAFRCHLRRADEQVRRCGQAGGRALRPRDHHAEATARCRLRAGRTRRPRRHCGPAALRERRAHPPRRGGEASCAAA